PLTTLGAVSSAPAGVGQREPVTETQEGHHGEDVAARRRGGRLRARHEGRPRSVRPDGRGGAEAVAGPAGATRRRTGPAHRRRPRTPRRGEGQGERGRALGWGPERADDDGWDDHR